MEKTCEFCEYESVGMDMYPYKDCFMNYTEEEKYNNLHQYSKNKIHCHHRADAHDGVKTNNRGRQKWYGVGSKNWKPSDLRKVVGLMEQLQCLI